MYTPKMCLVSIEKRACCEAENGRFLPRNWSCFDQKMDVLRSRKRIFLLPISWSCFDWKTRSCCEARKRAFSTRNHKAFPTSKKRHSVASSTSFYRLSKLNMFRSGKYLLFRFENTSCYNWKTSSFLYDIARSLRLHYNGQFLWKQIIIT